MSQITDSFGSVLQSAAWDVMLIGFFVVAGFIWGVVGGRSRLNSSLFAIYISLLVFPLLPLDRITSTENLFWRGALFIVLAVIIMFFLDRVVMGTSRSTYPWWKTFFISFLEAGLLISGALKMLPKDAILELSPFTIKFFTGNVAHVTWLLVPLAGFWIIARFR